MDSWLDIDDWKEETIDRHNSANGMESHHRQRQHFKHQTSKLPTSQKFQGKTRERIGTPSLFGQTRMLPASKQAGMIVEVPTSTYYRHPLNMNELERIGPSNPRSEWRGGRNKFE